MPLNRAATKRLTASGEVSAAGVNTRVYSITFLSGATAGSSTFKTGGASGTTLLTYTCPVVSASSTIEFGPGGMLFIGGCYWTKDANTSEVTVTYETEVA
jgi:hypothetical protein